MNGIRTKTRGFTSCAGLDIGDSIESIGNASKSMFKLITKLRAGIGVNPGKIRGLGADIGNGIEEHTGITPYLKVYEAISKSSQQPNSGRSGAVTNDYPYFHWEIENIMQLKNNKGTDENRVRHSDHSITFNDLFFERLRNNENITLFHMNDVGDLYERIGEPEYFKEKYEELENKKGIKKRVLQAKSLYDSYWNERFNNGRVYKLNAEAMNNHSAFKLPAYTSNLCREINLLSYPDENVYFDCDFTTQKDVNETMEYLYYVGGREGWYSVYSFLYYDTPLSEQVKAVFPGLKKSKKGKFKYNFGEIFSCILGGVNFAVPIKRIEKLMELQVRFLDSMIEYQDYVDLDIFEKSTKKRRALGISPSNLFYMLAKNDADYDSKEAMVLVSEYMEHMLYYGIKASNELAKELGPCGYYNDTKYSDGITPLDTYNKNVDKLIKDKRYIPKKDWDKLKEDIKKYGMRNSTILTVVPASNSSRVSNSVSGINPPQELIYTVEDKRVNIKAALPELRKYKKFYRRNYSWNIDTIKYTKLVAVIQKYVDQGISLNTYYDLTAEKYVDGKIKFSEIVELDAVVHKYGIKSLYYNKTKTDDQTQDDIMDDGICSSGGCEL
jgi:ribonucleoside-diphosphate reductase alpha chain